MSVITFNAIVGFEEDDTGPAEEEIFVQHQSARKEQRSVRLSFVALRYDNITHRGTLYLHTVHFLLLCPSVA